MVGVNQLLAANMPISLYTNHTSTSADFKISARLLVSNFVPASTAKAELQIVLSSFKAFVNRAATAALSTAKHFSENVNINQVL